MFVCCHWLNACGWVGVSFFLSHFLSLCLMPDAYIHENHLHAVAVFIYRNHCIRMAKKRNKMSSTKAIVAFSKSGKWMAKNREYANKYRLVEEKNVYTFTDTNTNTRTHLYPIERSNHGAMTQHKSKQNSRTKTNERRRKKNASSIV